MFDNVDVMDKVSTHHHHHSIHRLLVDHHHQQREGWTTRTRYHTTSKWAQQHSILVERLERHNNLQADNVKQMSNEWSKPYKTGNNRVQG